MTVPAAITRCCGDGRVLPRERHSLLQQERAARPLSSSLRARGGTPKLRPPPLAQGSIVAAACWRIRLRRRITCRRPAWPGARDVASARCWLLTWILSSSRYKNHFQETYIVTRAGTICSGALKVWTVTVTMINSRLTQNSRYNFQYFL